MIAFFPCPTDRDIEDRIRFVIAMHCKQGPGFSLIGEKWKAEIGNQTTGLQNDVAVPKSGFRLAGLDESVAHHRRIVDRRAKIEVEVLRDYAVSQHCRG